MSITDLTVEQGRRGSLARSLDYPEKSHTPPHPIPPPPQNDSSIIKRMLPPTHAAYVMSQRKHPVALIMKIRQIVSYEARNGNLSPGSHRSLEANLLELNRVYGMCERIRGSPIPPMYTRHTSRLLMFWLFTLPVSLHGSGISKITSLLTTVISTFVMCSLDEIGIQIEQPFRIIPMKPLSAAVMRDVADALVCLPPTLAAATEDCRVEWLTTDCREEGQTMRRKQQVSLTPSWLVPAFALLRFCETHHHSEAREGLSSRDTVLLVHIANTPPYNFFLLSFLLSRTIRTRTWKVSKNPHTGSGIGGGSGSDMMVG